MTVSPGHHRVLLPETLAGKDRYRLMTDLIAPRPIAWISSMDPNGRANLAPFSYFQVLGHDPPTVVLGFGATRGDDGQPRAKDTLANVLATREFTISHVGRPLAEPANASAAEYPPSVSEWDRIGPQGGALASAPAHRVRPPRVADARASLECRLVHAIPLRARPEGPVTTTVVLAEVVCFTVEEGLLRTDESGHFLPMDPAQLAAVGRMGGIAYTETNLVFELPRPGQVVLKG